ncbi:1012_t:CDS:1, partial [Racocetra fulgida]
MEEETTSANTSSSSHGTMFLNFINGNYECINSNEDDYLLDNDNDNDNSSFISESLASEKFGTESTTNDRDCEMEICPFILDKLSYEKAHMIANTDENKEITWNDIDIEAESEIDTASVSVLESELPESTEESVQLIDNTSSK